jgi:hypothetical protein
MFLAILRPSGHFRCCVSWHWRVHHPVVDLGEPAAGGTFQDLLPAVAPHLRPERSQYRTQSRELPNRRR